MTIEHGSRQIILPALRARMGQWWYYISAMKMLDIAERISIAKEIHKSELLQDLLQRDLTDRASGIADYLTKQEQRLFNSLVIGTYGGDPKWHEVAIKNTPPTVQRELPTHLEGILGLLVLDGNEKLFAIDGQHRVAGIREALSYNKALQDEEVSVIFVAGVTQDRRKDDPEGFERTRRLFTTLNRYAKPVSKTDTIALDEDDAVAIVTRSLVNDHPLFFGKISPGQRNSIPQSDQKSFTNIVTLYKSLDAYLRNDAQGSWNQFKRFRPDEEDLKELHAKALQLWDIYCECFPELMEFRQIPPGENIAAKYRHLDGGHLLFRPVGLLASVRVVHDLMKFMNLSVEDAVYRIAQVPMDLQHEMWRGLVWNAKKKRMIAAGENQKAARNLMFYATGGDLAYRRTTSSSLKMELAGLLNKEKSEIHLPSPGYGPHQLFLKGC